MLSIVRGSGKLGRLPGHTRLPGSLESTTLAQRGQSAVLRAHQARAHLPSGSSPFELARTLKPLWPNIQHVALKDIGAAPRQLLARYRALNKQFPLKLAFGLCLTKGVLADAFVQRGIERKDTFDKRRLLAMGLFSGAFTGCAYHGLFNVLFPRLFGTARSASILLQKAAADGVIIFPFLYMPTFFFFDELCRFGSLQGLVRRWTDEIGKAMQHYVKIWPATMLIVFSVVPVELRVSFIASVSFAWLVILSCVSH